MVSFFNDHGQAGGQDQAEASWIQISDSLNPFDSFPIWF